MASFFKVLRARGEGVRRAALVADAPAGEALRRSGVRLLSPPAHGEPDLLSIPVDGFHVNTILAPLHLLLKVGPYVKPQELKLYQREGILASGKDRRSPARSPPICRGLDLLLDRQRQRRVHLLLWRLYTASDSLDKFSSVSSPSRRTVEFSTVVSCAQSTHTSHSGQGASTAASSTSGALRFLISFLTKSQLFDPSRGVPL